MPVTININQAYSCRPITFPGNSGLIGYFLELKVTPVKIETVLPHIINKIDIRETISGKITNSHASPIIKITVSVNIKIFLKEKFIFKIDASYIRIKCLKQCLAFLLTA